ncbi:MAG: Holliday junction DNA helicase RuvA [Candidatus Omnitrophota bacterium]
MITRIEGELQERNAASIVIKAAALFYEIFVPPSVLADFEAKEIGEVVSLVTYYYIQTDPSRSMPVLIGFLNPVEREFFEKFITVSGIGPKAALRALSVPISSIADAIDASDRTFLKTLPGVGEQRAREIIAKLQGKVGRFGLIQDGGQLNSSVHSGSNYIAEAMEVLSQLQYKPEEARRMVDSAIALNPKIKSAEELLNDVYKQKSKVGAL